MGVATFKSASMSMKTGHTNRTVASGGDVVLRHMETVSSKERIYPRVIELRVILLLEGDFGGASSQSVGVELEGDDSVLKEGAGPLPVT